MLNNLVLVNHWLHLSTAALLVGGMVFLVAILRPVFGRNSSTSGMGILVNEIHERFRKYVGILIIIIILTGIINSFNSVMNGIEASSGYIVVIRIKVLLAIGLFIIYGVNAFLIKEPKGNKDESCSCVIHPPLYRRILQIIALVLVFTILFLVIVLKFL